MEYFADNWVMCVVKLGICFIAVMGLVAWTFWLSRTRHK